LRPLLPPRQLRQSDDDPQSPIYVHIVQRIPGIETDRLAICAMASMLKSDLADWELLKVISARDGTPDQTGPPGTTFFI